MTAFLDRVFGPVTPVMPRRVLTPVNELEEALKEIVAGDSSAGDRFVERLLHAQVYVLVYGEIQDPPSGKVRPFIMTSTRGFPALCIFTAAERANPIQSLFPAFRSELQVDFTWVLQSAPNGLGLMVNPCWDVALEESPESFAKLRQIVVQ